MKRKIEPVYLFYQEKMILFSDIDHKSITNDKAKLILGLQFRLPYWLQTSTINRMIHFKLLKRVSQTKLEILSKD